MMGNSSVTGILQNQFWMKDQPTGAAPRVYDPEFGFANLREELKPTATQWELDAAGISKQLRDVCVDQRLRLYGCQRKHPILLYKCKGYMEEIQDCYHEWSIHDMKEFEREKRLNRRERLLREASMKE